MALVKSALEKALEKLEQIEDLTPEEKTVLREKEELKGILAEFFKGNSDKDALWKDMKGKQHSILREAQQIIAETLGLLMDPDEVKRRKDGILAIESLKEKKHASSVEAVFSQIIRLQKEYSDRKDSAIRELRSAMETNPQLRMRPVRTPDGRTVYQAAMSVDEAVQARLGEFLDEHDRQYNGLFSQLVTRLEQELK